ncbi:glycoside hydrolase family 15 protein [Lichenihabitans sp. PAMC28606]|uniref:glycoside hydrolase family 15 protein n=1 Tax=Lichenihabitans sp. PAMC28606 TaxID=2880932 RepID=UPI001D09B717|nr:glycoside hydrolase family 15 protein [Lichenihabitans sp. PAMC28606]UDL93123.1 glycoside hydrolase family 15 protein [Lichenihabitans sp. PAMC28606]
MKRDDDGRRDGSRDIQNTGQDHATLTLADLSPSQERQAFDLQDYAALGDGRSISIVAPNGAITWWCVPNIDSAPLLDALLDPLAGGHFTVAPTERFESARHYRRDSNVMETTFTTARGVVRLTESLNSTLAGRLPWCELARRIEVVSGTVTMRASLVFGTRGDTVSPWLQPNANGCIFHVGPVLGLFRTTDNLRIIEEQDRTIVAEGTLHEGERALIAVIAGEDQPLAVPPLADIDRRIEVSHGAWREWAEGLHYEGPYREAVRRSALALKLLLFSPTGAIAAAATTSLPERVGGEKNWDYRYAWVRDAGYTLNAFLRLGVLPESQAAFQWLIHRLGETGAKVCYRLDGGSVPPVRHLDIPGYRGSQPVVVGNIASEQHQHGIYGDIFEAASQFVAGGNILDQHSAFVLSELADDCAERWRIKDSGLWELQELQHYTMSKISAWQALARAVELAEKGHLPSTSAPRWSRERDRIATWVDDHCWSSKKAAYTFFAGSERLDASIALAVRFGFPNAERLSTTLDAIRRDLSHTPWLGQQSPWLYRYSGAEAEESCFVACTFWLVEAYATLGRRDEARALMDQALAALPASVGIMSEMLDVKTGNFIGNIPQGLSHLSLIHAAVSLNDRDAAPLKPGRPASVEQVRAVEK